MGKTLYDMTDAERAGVADLQKKLAGRIEDLVNPLNAARDEYSKALMEMMAAKADLEHKWAVASGNGEIVGKNADEREGCARLLLSDQYDRLLKAEINAEATKAVYDMRKNAWDAYTYYVRTMETIL